MEEETTMRQSFYDKKRTAMKKKELQKKKEVQLEGEKELNEKEELLYRRRKLLYIIKE